MERKFLEGMGLDKEVIDKIMAANGKDIETHKANAEGVATERDALKEQLATVQETLKKFDGVDVDALKGEVSALQESIAQKEQDFAGQIAARDFDSLLNEGITAAKGKNAKAIKALLDMETLKTSKNQKEDMAAAIKAISESDSYLFETEDKQKHTPAKVNTGGEHNDPGEGGDDPFVAGFKDNK